MSIVATLVTDNALEDLQIFLKSLELWSSPTVYIYTDTATEKSLQYNEKFIVKSHLINTVKRPAPKWNEFPGNFLENPSGSNFKWRNYHF